MTNKLPVHAISANYYTDVNFFEREKQHLFSRSWQYACHQSQIPNKGDYLCFDIAGDSLVTVRGKDDEIRTFYNVCQHRAHQLVEGSGNKKVFVCPYHAWTYELDGALRSGPNINVVPGFDKSKICLTQVKTEVFLGFVFVNLANDAPSMDTMYPQVREQLAEFRERAPFRSRALLQPHPASSRS